MNLREYRETEIGFLSTQIHHEGSEEELAAFAAGLGDRIWPGMTGHGHIYDPRDVQAVQDAARNAAQSMGLEVAKAISAGTSIALWLIEYAVRATGTPAAEILQELALDVAQLPDDDEA
jgi:hypothetical protein